MSPLPMNLQVVNFQRREHVSLDCFFKTVDSIESSKEPEPVHSMSGMSEAAACSPSPSADRLQLYHPPPHLPPPGSNCSCLFTQCPPLYASYCTVLLCCPRYCTVRLKMFSLFLLLFFIVCFLCIIWVKSIISL